MIDKGINLYLDNGRIAGEDSEWIQERFKSFLNLLEWVRIPKKQTKNKSMVCIPLFVWGRQGEMAYHCIMKGRAPSYHYKKRVSIWCSLCESVFEWGFMQSNMQWIHGNTHEVESMDP